MGRSILQNSEREYLKSKGCIPNVTEIGDGEKLEEKVAECNVDESKAKYRIHNEVGQNLPEIIRQFRADISAVNMFYLNVKKDGWYEYENIILPRAKDELESLRDHLDTLIEHAERDMMDERREQFREPVASLRDGLEYLNAFYKGDRDVLEHLERVDGELREPQELVEEKEEFKKRKQALLAVLSDEGLLEIFEWVSKNEKTKVPDRTKSTSDETWKQAIGKYLMSSEHGHGLVEESVWFYELTERGQVVMKCWEELKHTSVVETKLDTLGDSRREVAWRLLNRYFDAENRWE
jgi:hypothetical protein